MPNLSDPKKLELQQLLKTLGPQLNPAVGARLSIALTRDNVVAYRDAVKLLIEQVRQTQTSVQQAKRNQEELQKLLQKLTQPPLVPATVTDTLVVQGQIKPEVAFGNQRRVVSCVPEVEISRLGKGSEVLLNQELNLVVEVRDADPHSCGEAALFDRWTDDGRLVLKWHDEELVAVPADILAGEELERGDMVRFDRLTWLAYEKLDMPPQDAFFLADVPSSTRDHVGGQSENLEKLVDALAAVLVAPEKAAHYGLDCPHTVLMVGPPGCGKTLMARVAAYELARSSGTACRFGVVKPSEWEDPFVGVTQRKMRECFKALGDAAQEGFAVLFLDEIEAIGRTRGDWAMPHSDRFLASLLVELDGFQETKNIAIIAATNRKDLLDPALLERLSSTEIRVNRPNRDGAKAIFEIHLPETLPFCPDGRAARATRNEIIDLAVSRFFAPNNDNAICSLQLRDGKQRTVFANELASGRLFQQVCKSACRSAFSREVSGGKGGVTLADMREALDQAIERLSTTLSPRNAHSYLADLPQDVPVVSAEPVVRRAKQAYQYLNVS